MTQPEHLLAQALAVVLVGNLCWMIAQEIRKRLRERPESPLAAERPEVEPEVERDGPEPDIDEDRYEKVRREA